MTAKLYAIEKPSLADIPVMLRKVADDIESGEYGEAKAGVLVLDADSLNVFAWGCVDGTVAYYLLCCAAHKMQRPMLD